MSIVVAMTVDGTRVPISSYSDAEHKGKVSCQLGHPVIAKKGSVIVHHYAHAPGTKCSLSHPKSSWHWTMQLRLKSECIEVAMKGDDGKVAHIADALVDGKVIEFQRSPISNEDMKEREEFYTKKMGYEMCWVFCCTRDTSADIVMERKEGNLICVTWRAGQLFALRQSAPAAKVRCFVDMGGMDLYEVVVVKKRKAIFRIIRLSEFEREWYGDNTVEEDPSHPLPWRREQVWESLDGNVTLSNVKHIAKEFFGDGRRK